MWPGPAVSSFQSVAHIKNDESAYYGPYNKLLNILFPVDSEYEVVPHYKKVWTGESINFVTLYVVELERHPVFFVEIMPPVSLDLLSKRGEADAQMRRCFAELSDGVVIPTLHGVSAIGTKLCFYKYDKAAGRITPDSIPAHADYVTDVAPKARWDCDVMDNEGEQRLRMIVAEINAHRAERVKSANLEEVSQYPGRFHRRRCI